MQDRIGYKALSAIDKLPLHFLVSKLNNWTPLWRVTLQKVSVTCQNMTPTIPVADWPLITQSDPDNVGYI